MPDQDLLLTIAELALALAGFSGVMTAFMKRPGQLTTVEVYRLAVLLGIAFGATFLALLPLVLAQLGAGGAPLWRGASAVMAAYSAIAVAVFLVSSRYISRRAPELFNWYLMGGIAAGHAANILLQLVNAARPAAAPGLYTIGLLWYLFHGAVQFSRILFVQPADR